MFKDKKTEKEVIELKVEISKLKDKMKELEDQQQIFVPNEYDFLRLSMLRYAPLKKIVFRLLDHLNLEIEYVPGQEENYVLKELEK